MQNRIHSRITLFKSVQRNDEKEKNDEVRKYCRFLQDLKACERNAWRIQDFVPGTGGPRFCGVDCCSFLSAGRVLFFLQICFLFPLFRKT